MARKSPLKLVEAETDAKSKPPVPPAHLGVDGLELWTSIREEYGITDPGGLALLRTAAEAADRIASCRRQLDEQGEVLTIRGVPRAHPAAAIERDSRAALVRAIRYLNLDVEPLRDRPGRPTTFNVV
jgi:hypothetical protein